jgi:hypothetical protein
VNHPRPHAPAALTTATALTLILLGGGCSAAASSGSPVLVAHNSSNPASTAQPAADSGMAGCTALLDTRQTAAGYSKARSEFLRSRWPDLRAAGTSYADLAVKLRSARDTDGYETVWFYQRLAMACARHGWKTATGR